MCNTWAHPSKASEEFTPELLRKLPDGLGRVNITGGEPTLRRDLEQIVAVLAPKAERLEISTNGYLVDRLVAVGSRYPQITVRISLEGLAETNDSIRGLKDGYEHGMRAFTQLREAGVKDLGFAMTIQDANVHDVLPFCRVVSDLGAELATAVPHNGYYFHTESNEIQDLEAVQEAIRGLIEAFLGSRRPKEWFRAYLNRGLVDYAGGGSRRLACTAGTDIFFLDPWGEVYPCNAWDLRLGSMGNLHEQSFEDLWHGARAEQVRRDVATCQSRCWMTGTAVPAIKRHLPQATWWVLRNKARLAVGRGADLEG
jgi:MoaA/NifB/PqqE/SkfB family radical SAM enzyme